MCSTLRLPRVMDSQWCNNIVTDWFVRIPANPPPAELKVKMLLELHEGENAIPECHER